MRTDRKLNMTMLCDFYELTMGNGYLKAGYKDRITYFDVYFRNVPDKGGFAIAAGLDQLIDYIEDLHFTDEDIAYLRGRNIFCEEFLDYLKNFKFTGDIYAVPEGTPVFPKEPMVVVRAPAIEAQLLETFTLLTINHQSLVATKANRIVRAARGKAVMEFGSRRAQGSAAAIDGARAAYIAGCVGTACTISDELYGTPALGTMAHAWVQMFDSEYEAFCAYCRTYPTNAVLLVDTYNTLKSGIPNAIRAFNDVLKPMGITKCGIRLDSGDIAYLSRKAREMLDEAGWTDCTITVSNSLDEYLIQDLWLQDAKIDAFGVGERLITARSEPVFGGVYKLVAVEDDAGNIIPKIKISENVGKITTPHFKKLWRFYGRDTGKAIADYLSVYDETVDDSGTKMIFDPEATWKRKEVYDFFARELLVPIYQGGKLVYKRPTIEEIKAYCAAQVDTLWDEVKRFDNPHDYYVDLSEKLYNIKMELLNENSNL
ncbi:MAG: nicotinate phosphoribosyltransferase [Oscillospiraceae bacterium]|jgi:nicotinate phosphoribosyltransferase|nr:nicotinate phosphoribosyltransferase [Oscillospiraceae bacterium]MBQ1620223.1 nicotinate phosphoribosyltransferase [Oscillospiraceae bacterium]MBQ1742756.1 nicotinate phosphoribosyltransferase [Oscillospiraceae bacterium]MBQ1834883.1 nicotinate phosphoribosyltransferase [Oscillospiraceae bacterium]